MFGDLGPSSLKNENMPWGSGDNINRQAIDVIAYYTPIDKRSKSTPFQGVVTGSNPVGSTI